MMENALNQLEDNITKKNHILDNLQILCDKQAKLLGASSMSKEEFNSCVEEQDALIVELSGLNEEADLLYKRLQTELADNKEKYAAQIARVLKLLQQIQDKSTFLQVREKSNKEKLAEYFQKERKDLGAGRKSSKAALDYYAVMSKSNVVPPQFMDQKK